jgi:hypothetical protein
MSLMTSQVYASLDLDHVCFPGHLMVYPWLAHARGRIVAISTHMGPIPELRLMVEDGRVTQGQGGGRWGEELSRGFDYLAGMGYPGYPGPGVNWVEEISLAVDPKAARGPNREVNTSGQPEHWRGWKVEKGQASYT